MGNYYLLDRSSLPGRWIGTSRGTNEPKVDWYYWRKGALLPKAEVVPDPITFLLRPYSKWSSDDSPHMPAYLRASAPLFRDDFIQALSDAGVDNLITYNCAITDPDNGKVYTNYKAVNVLGLIAAADMDKSNAIVHPNGPPLIDVDFDGLVMDENKTYGALLFRLAESNNTILVHKSVKKYIESRGYEDIAFYETNDVAL